MERGSIRLEIAVNLVFSILRAALILWLMRVAGLTFSGVALGLFLLARRHTSTASAFLSLGAPQTIQRYISLNFDRREKQRNYFLVAFGLLGLISLIIIPVAWLGKGLLSLALFDDPLRGELAFIVVLYVLVSILLMLVLSTLMALRRFYTYNLLNLATAGVLPLIAVYYAVSDPEAETVLGLTVLLVGGISVLLAILIARGLGWRGSVPDLPQTFRDFRDFGFPRTLSVGLDATMLTIGAWWLRDRPDLLSYLILALTLFRLFEMLLIPASQVLALASVRSMQKSESDEPAIISGRMIVFAIWAGALSIALIHPVMDRVILLWLGNQTLASGVSDFGRILIWGLPFAILFYTLRNVIELRWKLPLNLITQVVSLTGFIMLVLLLPNKNNIVVAANTVMLVICGSFSLFWLRREIPEWRNFKPGLLLLAVSAISGSQYLASGLPTLGVFMVGFLWLILIGFIILKFAGYMPLKKNIKSLFSK
jgi:O-antigen/teichoic acid export membrane protein